MPCENAQPRCWWDGPPWHGQITDAEHRAIVVAYVAHHGHYAPDLPEREPAVLQAWLAGEQTAENAEPWNLQSAWALIRALYHRVAAAWDATPAAQRPADARLRDFDGAIQAAYDGRDTEGLRRAIHNYEEASEPIFAAWRHATGTHARGWALPASSDDEKEDLRDS
jgi:hypothetical protein